MVHDVDEILAGRSIVPAGFTGNWEAWLLRRRLRRRTKVAALGAALVLVVGAGLFAWQRERSRRAALDEAEGAVLRALEETGLSPADDLLSVQGKLLEANAVLARSADLAPPGADRLRGRAQALTNEVRYFQDLEQARREAAALLEAGRFDAARALLEQVSDRIPGADGPAERTALDLQEQVARASAAEFERLRTRVLRQPSRSFDDLLEQQRSYLGALDRDFIRTPVLEAGRTEAAGTVAALEEIQRDLLDLESAYQPAPLAPRLDAPRLAETALEFERRWRNLLDHAARVWAKQEPGGAIPWTVIQSHLRDRLEALEAAVDGQVAERGRDVLARARAASQAGRPEDALALLTAWADACQNASYPALRADAVELREALSRELERARGRAEQDLRAVEKDVIAALRAGRPRAARQRLQEMLASIDERWPFREDLGLLGDLVDAWDALVDAAKDDLVARREVADVRLRDGTVERRWYVVQGLSGEPAVVASTSPGGAGVRRELSDVDPGQLAEWATRGGRALPPLERAVAILTALSEEDPSDLRPLLRDLRRLTEAFREAGIAGGIAQVQIRHFADVDELQRKRETTARGYVQAADRAIQQEEYEDALVFLGWLLQPGSWYQVTDAFENNRARIEEMMARAEAQVANRYVAGQFPGAHLTSTGDRTSIAYDFESVTQLESFRRGEGRAWGARESYVSPRELTPDRTNHRFHLKRGMDALTPDLPFALPCPLTPPSPSRWSSTCSPGPAPSSCCSTWTASRWGSSLPIPPRPATWSAGGSRPTCPSSPGRPGLRASTGTGAGGASPSTPGRGSGT